MRLNVSGPTELKARLLRYAREYPAQTAYAVHQVGLVKTLPTILAITPVDKGFLRASNRLLEPEETPGRITMTFVNPIRYAAPVHENLFARHASGTMAKFVEGPVLRDLPEYVEAIVETTEKILREGA